MAIWSKLTGGVLASVLAFGGLRTANGRVADEKRTAAVDEVFADLTKAGSPGCALGVYRDGKILYSKGYGLANLEESVPISPQSVFDIGSTSKQFTAASVLLLEKQGKLSVNDDVRKYMPELPDYGQTITILHLLNHTSGLRDYLTLMSLAGINFDSVTTDDDALQLVVRQKALNFAPGSDWLYSNTEFLHRASRRKGNSCGDATAREAEQRESAGLCEGAGHCGLSRAAHGESRWSLGRISGGAFALPGPAL